MPDNIDVSPSEESIAVSVATDEIGGTHYPIYKLSVGSLGTQIPVDEDNPLPVDLSALLSSKLTTDETMLALLYDIYDQLKIMNLYNAITHNQELTKEDLG